MYKESKEKRDIPPPILFHGTTLERFQSFLQEDSSYRDPKGDAIWFDATTSFPLTLAHTYQEEYDSDIILVFARSDQLKLERPRNAVRSPGQLITPNYWTTYTLPPGSFVNYNVTTDPLKLFNGGDLQQHMKGIIELCKPLGTIPDYVRVFTK